MITKRDTVEAAIEDNTRKIKLAMSELGRRLKSGDDSKIIYWVIPNKLACAHRPLRHHPVWGGSGSILPEEATDVVFKWADRVRKEGIRCIVSLMHDRDVRCYQELRLGATSLLEFYEKQGFQVSRVPWEDPHHKKSSPQEKRRTLVRIRKEALAEYHKALKPVLIQCSAGIDRSSPVAAFILAKAGHSEAK